MSWSQEELVAAAYAVVFVFVLVYVAIIAAKLVRLQRETAELDAIENVREKRDRAPSNDEGGEHRAGHLRTLLREDGRVDEVLGEADRKKAHGDQRNPEERVDR